MVQMCHHSNVNQQQTDRKQNRSSAGQIFHTLVSATLHRWRSLLIYPAIFFEILAALRVKKASFASNVTFIRAGWLTMLSTFWSGRSSPWCCLCTLLSKVSSYRHRVLNMFVRPRNSFKTVADLKVAGAYIPNLVLLGFISRHSTTLMIMMAKNHNKIITILTDTKNKSC